MTDVACSRAWSRPGSSGWATSSAVVRLSVMSLLEVNPDTVETDLPAIVDELLQGAGVIVIRNSLSPDDLVEARELIMQYSAMEGDKITHFHGGHEDQVHLQRRVWNLLNKGEVFERMVQHPTVMKISGAFLGS